MVRHRLRYEDYSAYGAVWLVTLVTNFRNPYLANDGVVRSVIEAFQFKADQTGSELLLWCAMPDHLHALVTVGEGNLVKMIGEIKSFTSRAFKQRTGETLWQPSFHDSGVRLTQPLDEVAKYITNNPVRAGLVRDWSEWAHTGGMLIDSGNVSDSPE